MRDRVAHAGDPVRGVDVERFGRNETGDATHDWTWSLMPPAFVCATGSRRPRTAGTTAPASADSTAGDRGRAAPSGVHSTGARRRTARRSRARADARR